MRCVDGGCYWNDSNDGCSHPDPQIGGAPKHGGHGYPVCEDFLMKTKLDALFRKVIEKHPGRDVADLVRRALLAESGGLEPTPAATGKE